MRGRKTQPEEGDEDGEDRRTTRLFAYIIGFVVAGCLAEIAEKIQHHYWMKERGVGFWEFAPWDLHWEYFLGTGIYLDLVTLVCWLLAWYSAHLLSRGGARD